MSQMDEQNLERFVVEYEKAGRDWVEAKLVADQLEEGCKPYLDSLRNEIDNGEMTEAKIERLARGSKQYREYVFNMCCARAEALRKKVRFDALDKLFEARRSQLAYERDVIKKGIFSRGGKS